jgi:tRNA/rRNA methyltransferase
MSDLRVVLVRPQIAANIGATARVMRNMGLADLILVAPEADPLDASARQLSTHGESILHAARIVPDLPAAVADCVRIAATSAKVEGRIRGQSQSLPGEVLPLLVRDLAHGPTAVVFGPERDGLLTAEIARCHHLIHIPTNEEYSALNLAQSVAICLYEYRMARLRADAVTPASPAPVSFELQDRMFAALRDGLERVGFLYDERADALWHAIRQLIARAGPTDQEAKILLGLARQLRWYTDQEGESPG